MCGAYHAESLRGPGTSTRHEGAALVSGVQASTGGSLPRPKDEGPTSCPMSPCGRVKMSRRERVVDHVCVPTKGKALSSTPLKRILSGLNSTLRTVGSLPCELLASVVSNVLPAIVSTIVSNPFSE